MEHTIKTTLSGVLPIAWGEPGIEGDGPGVDITTLEEFISDAKRAGATRLLFLESYGHRRIPSGIHFFVDNEGF